MIDAQRSFPVFDVEGVVIFTLAGLSVVVGLFPIDFGVDWSVDPVTPENFCDIDDIVVAGETFICWL